MSRVRVSLKCYHFGQNRSGVLCLWRITDQVCFEAKRLFLASTSCVKVFTTVFSCVKVYFTCYIIKTCNQFQLK